MRSTDQYDPFNLQRFVQAQDPVFERVQRELDEGRKRSHWMWFVFPQFAGLGGSEMSRRYAIQSAEEAARPIWPTICLAHGCAPARNWC